MTVVPLPSDRQPAGGITQTTAVEQARAIAEVQAAIVVAQQNPRDLARAEAEMREACGRTALANRAFYSVPNRGRGPSVHLARELARVWGNIDYGVRELRRDDEHGVSEVQAFAWDQQTNVRSTRTFQVPHQRMKGGRREALVDLGDVYLNNQNVGARAVRECIFSTLPTWFVEAAQEVCHHTIEKGDGTPLRERVANMVAAFRGLGVVEAQLEARTRKARGAWDAGDVANLIVVWQSITRGETSIEDEFAPAAAPVTASEIQRKPEPAVAPKPAEDPVPAAEPAAFGEASAQEPVTLPDAPAPTGAGPEPTEAPAPWPPTAAAKRALHAALGKAGLGEREDYLRFLTETLGRAVASTNDLDAEEVSKALDELASIAPTKK